MKNTFIGKFIKFGIDQAYAAMFGGFLLAVMVITYFWYPIDFIHRYDFIFLSAISFQAFLLITKLESKRESLVIIIFHIVATVMELFKTSDSIGSWYYPEEYIFGIGNVPLFTGFMYSAVGSYITRVWKIFKFKYENYPSKSYSIILVILIYLNFFTHHYIVDLRWILLALGILLFWKTKIYYKIFDSYHMMPLIMAWFLSAFFVWIAENIATFANVWIYPNQQQGWEMVTWGKFSSWILLMLLSFVLVTLVNPIEDFKSSQIKDS